MTDTKSTGSRKRSQSRQRSMTRSQKRPKLYSEAVKNTPAVTTQPRTRFPKNKPRNTQSRFPNNDNRPPKSGRKIYFLGKGHPKPAREKLDTEETTTKTVV